MAKRKAQQQPLPGVPQHSPSDPELQDALEELRVIRADRIEKQQAETIALKKAIALRNTRPNPPDVFRYRDEDGKTRVAKFKVTMKVSVRADGADDDDDSDGDNTGDGGVSVS